MTDANDDRPLEDAHFNTDEVQASRAREQGLGLGQRELEAQGDPARIRAADEEPEMADGVSVNAGDEDALNQSLGMQGSSEDASA